MTAPRSTHDTICDEIRRRPRDDGELLGVFVDEAGAIALTVAVSEGTTTVDELFLRHLVAMVLDVGLAAVVFAVVRSAGRPARVDKRLWQELTARLTGLPTELLDLVVVGETLSWSAAVSQRRRSTTSVPVPS